MRFGQPIHETAKDESPLRRYLVNIIAVEGGKGPRIKVAPAYLGGCFVMVAVTSLMTFSIAASLIISIGRRTIAQRLWTLILQI